MRNVCSRRSCLKKIFMLTVAALLMFANPAQAADYTIHNAGSAPEVIGTSVEKFYDSLPKAKGDYKSRQRPIVIEGAMNTETEIFVRALKNPVTYRELNYLFVAGTYENYPVVVVRTEQGVANAAASTALAIKKFNPIAVINQGTSGGHDPNLKIGDIVIGAKSYDYTAIKTDYAAIGEGTDLTKHQMRGTYSYDEESGIFQSHKEHFADPTLFNIAFAAAKNYTGSNIVSGVISTGNSWLNNLDYIKFLHETYGSSCEEMETDAAAQICHTANVPFIGIRIISNNITISKDYEPITGKTCQEFVLRVVENYIRDVLKNKH